MARRRLSPEELLDHPKRRRIVRIVREKPGITASEAQARLGIPLGTFYHHLNLLRKNGLVQAHFVGRRCSLYPPGASEALDAAARSLLRGNAVRAVARAIADRPGGSVADAAEHSDKALRTVYHHVEQLIDAGLVDSSAPMRRYNLRPTPRLLRLLAERP